MLGNYVSVGNIFSQSRTNSAQAEDHEQYALTQGPRARTRSRQAQDNYQHNRTPNTISARISQDTPRRPDWVDVVEIYNIASDTEAESFELQGIGQESDVSRPTRQSQAFSGEADNESIQLGRNTQSIEGENHVRGRIDHPGFFSLDGRGPSPRMDITAENITADAGAKNTQLQDAGQRAAVNRGETSNDSDQQFQSRQRARGRNHVGLNMTVSGFYGTPLGGLDPWVAGTYNNGRADNFQGQSLGQVATTGTVPAEPEDGKDKFLEILSNGQGVISGDEVALTVDKGQKKVEDAALAHLSTGIENGNEQGQAGSQFAHAADRSRSSNSGNMEVSSEQDLGSSGAWLNLIA